MTKYTCERCLKEFAQKSHYNTHMKRKTPCQNNKEKNKQEVEKQAQPEVENVIIEDTKSKEELTKKIETKTMPLKSFYTLTESGKALIDIIKETASKKVHQYCPMSGLPELLQETAKLIDNTFYA